MEVSKFENSSSFLPAFHPLNPINPCESCLVRPLPDRLIGPAVALVYATMNHRLLVAVLALVALSPFARATDQTRINKTLRELRSLPEGTTEVSEALPLVKTLVRLDPQDGREYFDEYLKKIVPAGSMTAQQAIGEASEVSLSLNAISKIIEAQTAAVEAKLKELQSKPTIEPKDLFEIQLKMNLLAQLSEMSTSIISASNSAIASMARNVKG